MPTLTVTIPFALGERARVKHDTFLYEPLDALNGCEVTIMGITITKRTGQGKPIIRYELRGPEPDYLDFTAYEYELRPLRTLGD